MDGSGPMRVLHSALRRGDTPVVFALKEGKTDLVKILANCPQVDLDVVDEDFNHLENMRIFVDLSYLDLEDDLDVVDEEGFVEDVEDIGR